VIDPAWIVSDFWNDQLVEHDRQWMFLVLLGIVLSFGFIRLSTRLMRSPRVPWWPGSVVSEGGLHVHHLVFGIVLMIAAGSISFAGFATNPIYEICAFLFGVGVGLTIDEFALWLYLDDVYWSKEGRSSVDAAVVCVLLLGLALIGVRPLDLSDQNAGLLIASILAVILSIVCILICFAKGRFWHGVVGVFFLPFSLYGACRLGKPGSAWARRFYGERNPEKQARSARRFPPDRRTERVKNWLRDVLGGTPEDEYLAKVAARAERNERG
jgi:hypothetical protein